MIYNGFPNDYLYHVNPFKSNFLTFGSDSDPSLSRLNTNKLQQLKMNNPFEKMNPNVKITKYQNPLQRSKSINPNFNKMDNPFHRKYLFKNEYQSLDYDYLQPVSKQVATINRNPSISEMRNTFQSLQFLPSNSKKYSSTDENNKNLKETSKNRMGGDYNNQQIRFSAEEGQSKLFAQMIQNEQMKNANSQTKPSQLFPMKQMNNNILSSQVIHQIQSESRPTQKHSETSQFKKETNKSKLEQEQSSKRSSQRSLQRVSQSPVNSLIEEKLNELSYYQQTVKLEGKVYYLIPFTNS